jgi:2-dehydro-3-deoxygluconokinase
VTRVIGALGEGLLELGLEPAPDTSVTLGYGGDAANAAVMAARMGAEARILGRVGNDTLGERLRAFWSSNGVDVEHVRVDPDAPTGIYVNERGAEGLRRFDYHRRGSAGSRLSPADAAPAFLDGLGVLHVTGITLAVSASACATALDLIPRARDRRIRVSLAVNHRPALGGDVETLGEAARMADIVFVSEEEAGIVFGTSDPVALAAELDADELVLTRGHAGAVVVLAGAPSATPAPAVSVVDPAGAGDALAGAYLAARLAGDPPHRALQLGVVAAALSCRARGCALSYPSRDEVVAAAQEA